MKKKLIGMILAAGAMLGAWARTYTAADFGKVVCADGSVYATAADASSAGKTARAMIACVDGNYVLAIALADTSATGLLWGEAVESAVTWTADKAVAGGQWRLPSADDFKRIFSACGGSEYTASLAEYMEFSWGDIQTMLSSAGGTQLDDYNTYWLSDEASEGTAWGYRTNSQLFRSYSKSNYWCLARPVLAFGAARTYKKVQLWENGPYWAETNIGADEAWDSGYYFWWGDTIGYKRVNDAWVATDGSSSNFEFYNNPISMTTCQKVSILRNSGWIITKDDENYLVPEHDAAHVQWGGDWRMPTGQEIDELREKCEWTWTTTNGVIGYIVRGRGDYASSSVFIPAAGCGDEAELTDVGMDGFWSSNTYWHDSTSDSDSFYSKYLSFNSTYQSTASFYRYYGRPIRPVCSVTAHGDGVTPDVTINAGEYFKATLVELGYDVPTDGQTAYSVKAYGLPAGLKLMSNKAVKDKKGKVITKANVEWWIEGVPTAALDYATNPAYLVITVDGKTETLPLSLGVEAQDVTELDDLALGEELNEQFYLPGVTSSVWTVSGLPTGLKYTAKLVTTTKKKGKKVVSVTTNALPYSVYGKTTKAGLFTITAKKKVSGFYETMKYRVLVKPAAVDTALFGENLTNITTMAYVPFEWDLTNDVAAAGGKVAKVAGLPAGLTFAAATTYKDKKKTQVKQYGQTIIGKPTKPGTYVVTFTKNVTTGTGKNKKTVAKTAQILWTVVESDVELSLGFNEKGGVIESGTVGLSYGDLMAFDATDGAKVTASGLPAGIKLADLGDGQYAFTGFTAKAGTYLVTVTATLSGKTVTQRVALKVDGLPSWAKGTYNGVVYATSGDLDYAGYGTVSVSSAGKISGKFQEFGTNWTFSASSYDFYTAKGGYDGDTEIFQCTNVVAKYAYKVTEKVKGKKKTVTKYLTRNYTLSAGNLEVSPGVMRGTVVVTSSGDDGLVAYQNVWGQSDYKALGKKLFYTSKKVPYKTWSDVDAKGLTDAMSLSVKVTSAGALTATMTFDTGKTTTDKKTKKKSKVYYKATCTTVLIPLSVADADPFKAGVSLYFAPSAANNFPGFCAEVEYPFAKRVAPQPGMANNWYADKDAGFGEMWGGSDAEPGEPCITLNCLWQNIWKRSDLSAEWKPAFASGTQKTLDMSEIWLDGKVDSDTLTYAFGANGAVEVSGQIYGESVSATATLDLEGYDDGTNTMHCNFYFLANGHMYQQQLTFQRQASIASSGITLASFQQVD